MSGKKKSMKKLAIVTRKMITGGVERALIAMLKRFDYTTVEVDLYLESLGGELFDEIPKEVNCIQIPSVRGGAALRHPLLAAKKLNTMRKLHSGHYSYTEQCFLSSKMYLPQKKEYDIAIAYHAPNTMPVYYTIDNILAEKKILWLHGDLKTNDGTNKYVYSYHQKYDRVFAVSQDVKDSFVKYHPEKHDSVELFHNFVDLDKVRELSFSGPTFSLPSDFNILTIGRLCKQKGIDLAIEAFSRIDTRGREIKWYVCGGGEDMGKLKQMIQDYGLEDRFILLGNQLNPYRYLRDCDLYVQPSRFEGYCTTTNEARILGKAVITTDVSGASEQFINGVTGWIVPIDSECIRDKLQWVLDHRDCIKTASDEVQKRVIQDNESISRILEF